MPFWIYRECVCYVLFLRGVLSPYVEWRSGTYKLKFGGTGVRVEPSGKRTCGCCKRRRARKRHVHPKKTTLPPTSQQEESTRPNSNITMSTNNQREIKIDASIPKRFGSTATDSSGVCSSSAEKISICDNRFYAFDASVHSTVNI